VAFSNDGYWSTDQNNKIQDPEDWPSYSCDKFSHASAHCHFTCTQRFCVIAHKHTIPTDIWSYPKVSERIKAGNCNEKSRTYTSMPEKTHTFNMTGKNDPKIWYHRRLENKVCHLMTILILVWVLTLQHHKVSKAELYGYYMIIVNAVIMTVLTCQLGQISLYCKV